MLDLKDVSDYLIGKYSTTAFTEAAFNYDIYLLQQMLDAKGMKDKFGNKLILDGIFGANTQWARDVLRSKNKKDYIIYYKDLWADSSTLQGVGVFDNGEIIFGENTDRDLIKLAKLVHQQSTTNNKLKFQKDIDTLSETLASKITFYSDGKITAEDKKKGYIDKITNINYYTIEDVTKQMTGALL